MIPTNICTQFGFIKPIALDKFVELIPVEEVNEFTYIRSNSLGFSFGEDFDPDVSDFLKVEPKTQKFFDLFSIKYDTMEEIRKNIDKRGEVQFLEEAILPHVEAFGEPTHLVLLPQGLVMPANLGDFRIRIGRRKGENHSAFCWFHSQRFFCHRFDFEKFLKDISENNP
jgi:hypothetical protein